MEFFKIECPFCRQRVEVSDAMIGSSVSCPTCHRVFTVPSPSGDDSTPAGEPAMAPMFQGPYTETVSLTENAVKFASAQAAKSAKKRKPLEKPLSLLPGEKIVFESAAVGSGVWGWLTGVRRTGRFTLTGERIVLCRRTFILWGIPVSSRQVSFLPQGICGVSCVRRAFSSRYLLRITLAGGKCCVIPLKNESEDEALRYCELLLRTMIRH